MRFTRKVALLILLCTPLLANAGDINQDLLEAAIKGDTTAVEALLARGVDVNVKTKLGETALMAAAGKGHIDTLRVLLAAGADVNAKENVYGVTALMAAVQKGHTAAVEILLEAGADVNAKAKGGETALIAAAINGHTAVVEALLAAGADVNAKTKGGETALMRAAGNGHTASVQALLVAGADVNAKIKEGYTALMFAAWDGHTASVQALLAAGADVNAKNETGETALMRAAGNGHTAAVKALLAKAAAVDAKQAHLALGSAYVNQYLSRQSLYKTQDWRDTLREQATAEFQKVLDMDPNNLAALEWMGQVEYRRFGDNRDRKHFEKAKSFFKKCIQLHPNELEPYYWLADINWVTADIANGSMRKDHNAKASEQLKEEDPLPEPLRQEFVSQYGAVVDEGIEVMNKVLELHPEDWEAIAYLNLLYGQKADQAGTSAEREKLLGMADAAYEKAENLKQEKGGDALFLLNFQQNPFRPSRLFWWPPPPPPPPPPQSIPVTLGPEQEWKESAKRIRVNPGAQDARRIQYVAPVYPPIAQQARISGNVRLEAIIGKSGTIQRLRVLGGHPLLVQAAIQAVQQWRYEPTVVDGEPVEVITEINVVFRMLEKNGPKE